VALPFPSLRFPHMQSRAQAFLDATLAAGGAEAALGQGSWLDQQLCRLEDTALVLLLVRRLG
jgi:hypothetical protein